MNFDHCRPFGANSRKIVEDHMDVIYFTQNITDPLNDADTKGAPVPKLTPASPCPTASSTDRVA
jgi:hypothetical protein